MNIKVEEILMVIVAFIIGYFLNGIINQNLVEGGVVSNDGVNAGKSKAEKADISLNYTKRQFNKKVESIYSSLDEISQNCSPHQSTDIYGMFRDTSLKELEVIKQKVINKNQSFLDICAIHG